MNIKNICNITENATGVTGFFSAYGNFGIVDGKNEDIERIETTANGYKADYPLFSAQCEFTEYENKVFARADRFIAKENLILNSYASRFVLEPGDYEVYTQYSSWQNESNGNWQTLVTGVEVANKGIQTTDGAIPMTAIRNKGNGKIWVFQLIANAQWKIKISRIPLWSKNDTILIETGFNCKSLNMEVRAGEEIQMPRVYFYEAKNPIDLDAYKFHTALLKDYKRKELPVLYNTWMSDFDNLSFDEMVRQAKTAADLGIEYFLIDAGWFGSKTSWVDNIGDWYEIPEGRFEGRLAELSQAIRNLGLKFGLWIEPERAIFKSKAYQAHPEFFVKGNNDNAFLNYADAQACDFIFETVCALIDKYAIEIMKFDFNAPLAFDETGCAFYRYFQGQQKLLERIKTKYPNIHLVNCAGGGNRMEMGQMEFFDSVWISDNQSPVDGLRIVKDTAKHFLPSAMQKWDVRLFAGGFPQYGTTEKAVLPLSCHNATWDSIINVDQSYTYAFISGGVMGFSANIADYPESEKKQLKELIAKYKTQREFYKNAVLRILHDAPNIVVLQYSDVAFKQSILHIFCRELYQSKITVYPVLDAKHNYTVQDETLSGEDIMDLGITVDVQENHCKEILILEKD